MAGRESAGFTLPYWQLSKGICIVQSLNGRDCGIKGRIFCCIDAASLANILMESVVVLTRRKVMTLWWFDSASLKGGCCSTHHLYGGGRGGMAHHVEKKGGL